MTRTVITERSSIGRAPEIRAPAFTGRERELTVLADALARPGAVVLIEGEAGIGKTRLLGEYLATRSCEAARPLVATCPPLYRPQTLGPVSDAVRRAVADVRGLGLSGLAGALRPVFPEWAADLPPRPEPAEDATAARYRLFAALAEVIDGLRVRLLVLEDAHWADEATVEFLLFLASRLASPGAPGSGQPVSLVVTLRPEDVPPGSLLPRLARLTTGGSGLRLALSALGVAGTAQMVSSMLTGEQLSAEFAGFLHEHTGGVPLAVEESVRLMAARADLARRGGQWVRRELARMSVPPPVRDAVLERADQLATDAQTVLRAAAVLGEPATEDTLAAIAGLTPGRARAGLAAALGCGLLAEDRRGLVSFQHVLAARAVYESVPGPQRRLLHRRAGQVLEGPARPPVAALARHFREAGDTGLWLRYGEQAADLALAAGDEATAAVLLRDLVIGGELSAPVVTRLANKIILLALPEDDRLRDLAVALRAVLDAADLEPAEEAGLRFQLGRTLLTMQEYDASRVELERALPGLSPGSLPAVRAMMLLGWPQGGNRPAAEHLRWLRRAAAADASVPPAERLRLLVDRATALLVLGEASGWAEADGIPWEAATPRDRLQVIRGHGNVGESALSWGRYADARRRLEHAVRLADGYHYGRLGSAAIVALAHLDWFIGSWAGLADRTAALAADDGLPALEALLAVLVTGLLQAAAGDTGQAIEDLRRVAGEAGRRGAVEYVMESAATVARLYLAQGDVTGALRVTEEPADIVAKKRNWLQATDLAAVRVAALARADRLDEATALASALAAWLRGRDVPVAAAALELSRAFMAESRGEYARAAALFGTVATAWLALPRPYDALLARERQACCLLAAGQDEAALPVLSEAAAGLRSLGARLDADRVARTLIEHGALPPVPRGRGRPSYGGDLSPRELEVVRLVAQGRTNRQIADVLVLSRQTVASHVHSAMRKLAVPSRTALAMSAAERGLLGDGGDEKNQLQAAAPLNPSFAQ